MRASAGPRLADNVVVALGLLIAGNDPFLMDQMIRLVLSLLVDETQ